MRLKVAVFVEILMKGEEAVREPVHFREQMTGESEVLQKSWRWLIAFG